MKIKFFHLNIEEGKRQEEIVRFVKTHDFDILQFQEVTGGKHNARGFENYPLLLEQLGYEGVQAVYWRLKADPETYMSNATFYKPHLQVDSSHIEFLKPYADLTEEEMADFPSHPTCALDVVFNINGKKLHCINTHLVWGPTPEDKSYKLEQGNKLYDYVKGLSEPFVLSGDFNVTPDSQIVRWIDELGVNHTTKAGITNTLNGNLHRVKHLFPSGLAVDFLYTHPSLQVSNFRLVEEDLSDHFGLAIEIEV